jgi:hypothetical protein
MKIDFDLDLPEQIFGAHNMVKLTMMIMAALAAQPAFNIIQIFRDLFREFQN